MTMHVPNIGKFGENNFGNVKFEPLLPGGDLWSGPKGPKGLFSDVKEYCTTSARSL